MWTKEAGLEFFARSSAASSALTSFTRSDSLPARSTPETKTVGKSASESLSLAQAVDYKDVGGNAQ